MAVVDVCREWSDGDDERRREKIDLLRAGGEVVVVVGGGLVVVVVSLWLPKRGMVAVVGGANKEVLS